MYDTFFNIGMFVRKIYPILEQRVTEKEVRDDLTEELKARAVVANIIS